MPTVEPRTVGELQNAITLAAANADDVQLVVRILPRVTKVEVEQLAHALADADQAAAGEGAHWNLGSVGDPAVPALTKAYGPGGCVRPGLAGFVMCLWTRQGYRA